MCTRVQHLFNFRGSCIHTFKGHLLHWHTRTSSSLAPLGSVAGADARRGETEVYFHTNSNISAVDQGCQFRTSCGHTHSDAVLFSGTRQFLASALTHRGGSGLSLVARLTVLIDYLKQSQGDSVQFFFMGHCTTNDLFPAFLCGKTGNVFVELRGSRMNAFLKGILFRDTDCSSERCNTVTKQLELNEHCLRLVWLVLASGTVFPVLSHLW